MNEPADERAERPEMQRAEEMLDQIGEQAGRIAASFGQYLRRTAARAREEAEDMLAEAESIRRGER